MLKYVHTAANSRFYKKLKSNLIGERIHGSNVHAIIRVYPFFWLLVSELDVLCCFQRDKI